VRIPRVFVSSTCFDLRQIRRDLKEFIEGSLGYEAVLSEFPSFPVDPDQTTVDNSRRVVRSVCDIFVLVVGGRYGTIDKQSGKSITNQEMIEARLAGLPIYVFLDRTVDALLPAWRDNPELTHPAIDDNRVLAFADEIKRSLHWIFPFDSAQEIVETLKVQWAYLFMDSLDKRRIFSDSDPAVRLGLTGKALEIALRQERGWEYRLFEVLLAEQLNKHAQLRRDVDIRFAPRLSQRFSSDRELVAWVEGRLAAGRKILSAWNGVMEQVNDAFGAPGVPGDAEKIVYVASSLGDIYRSALAWRLEFDQLEVTEELEAFREAASHYMDDVTASFQRALDDLRGFLSDFDSQYQPGKKRTYELIWTVSVPQDIQDRFTAELERLKERYA